MEKQPTFKQNIPAQLEALGRKNHDEEILEGFSPEDQKTISYRKRVLSSIVYFIGKDFQIPVELNNPGGGWHWDFKDNIVRADPKDLLEKSEGFSMFVMGHEAGHRRISRTSFIPLETWKQPGFAFLMNAVEDPRDNNFVSEGYPQFAEDLDAGYEWIEDMEKQASEKADKKLGYQPRFKQAGYEYIRQWFREINNQEESINEGLPEEVQEVVKNTVSSARDSWWTYPSKKEADESEENIIKYAYASYKINLEKIWPEFQKLVEMDMEDQKMQEFMKDMEKDKMEGGGNGGLPQEMKDKLTPEQQEELEKAIEEAIEKAKEENKKDEQGGEGEPKEAGEQEGSGKPMPIDMDSLSEELKKKIKEFMDSMPDDKKKELSEKAEKELGEFSKEVADDLQGKMTESPEVKAERESKEKKDNEGEPSEDESKNKPESKPSKPEVPQQESEDVKRFRENIEKELKTDKNIYEEKRREVLPIIDKLENDLREIFVKRRAGQWDTGYKYGKRIDIKKRIQEKAKGVSAVESRAWQKREAPGEKDYAITILNDLSGSMEGSKIDMDFKAKIVLAEVLNKLSIKCEILGFNDRIYEYQKFEQPMGNDIREKMGGMIKEVSDRTGGRARYNDDGWALTQASERLTKTKANQRFLIVLSDGEPVDSPQHSGAEYDLNYVVEKITKNTDQKLIGLGILTDSVSNYYPNYIENVGLEEMLGKLADLIRDVVVNYDRF